MAFGAAERTDEGANLGRIAIVQGSPDELQGCGPAFGTPR